MTQLSLLKPARQLHIHNTDTVSAQLLAYEFPATLAGRLANEHGWTPAFTEEVLREYRRFLVLAATSAQSVTPSKVVDAAWHEHLTHTRDYWLRLTPLLNAPLHHEPGEGTPADAEHFAAQYQHTLKLYRQRFGEPDSRLWPDPTGTPNKAAGHRSGSAQLWVLAGTVAVGLLLATLAKPWIGFGVVVALLTLAYLLTRPRRRRSGRGSGNGGDAGAMLLVSDSAAPDGGSDGGGSGCGGGCGS